MEKNKSHGMDLKHIMRLLPCADLSIENVLALVGEIKTERELATLYALVENKAWWIEGKRTIITRTEQSYGRVTVCGTLPFVHFRICSRCRTAGCQGISFSISSWVGDLPR